MAWKVWSWLFSHSSIFIIKLSNQMPVSWRENKSLFAHSFTLVIFTFYFYCIFWGFWLHKGRNVSKLYLMEFKTYEIVQKYFYFTLTYHRKVSNRPHLFCFVFGAYMLLYSTRATIITAFISYTIINAILNKWSIKTFKNTKKKKQTFLIWAGKLFLFWLHMNSLINPCGLFDLFKMPKIRNQFFVIVV